jgi:hypothetical protein
MPKEGYYKKMFFIGAIWNWVATLTFAIGWKFLFPLFGMASPNYLVFYMLFLGLCFVYGIGYFWVSRDISSNHGIVRMGIIGKLLVFAGFLIAWVMGGSAPNHSGLRDCRPDFCYTVHRVSQVIWKDGGAWIKLSRV